MGDEKLTVAAHGDGVGNTNGVELPAEHALLIDGPLDDLAKLEHCDLRISWGASSFGAVDSLVTYNVCYNNPISSNIPINCSKEMPRNILAWIALPPNTRNAHLRRRLHLLLVRHSSTVQHGLIAAHYQPTLPSPFRNRSMPRT